jgi:hypothetical protein
MSTQPRSDLKSTAPASVSRNAMNPFGAKISQPWRRRCHPSVGQRVKHWPRHRITSLRDRDPERHHGERPIPGKGARTTWQA